MAVNTTIAIANQKGGTGKTTTAVTLGHRLALDGLRVIIIDTDVQGHVAMALGMEKEPGIRSLVDWAQFGDQILLRRGRPDLWILPSDKSTEPAKRSLVSMNFRERILADALADLPQAYDVAVVDCAPSLDVLHVAALVAADWLIIPTRLDYLAVDGVNEVLTTVVEIRSHGSGPDIMGILPTFFDRTTNETEIQLRELVEAFGSLVWPPIPKDTKLREAPAHGQTIWEYAPTSRSVVGHESLAAEGIGGYRQFVERVRERMDV